VVRAIFRICMSRRHRHIHVLRDESVLTTSIDTSKWRHMPGVYGISGHRMETMATGKIGHLDGVALVTLRADSDLLSLMSVVAFYASSNMESHEGISGDTHYRP
jgi:hypothetical protein